MLTKARYAFTGAIDPRTPAKARQPSPVPEPVYDDRHEEDGDEERSGAGTLPAPAPVPKKKISKGKAAAKRAASGPPSSSSSSAEVVAHRAAKRRAVAGKRGGGGERAGASARGPEEQTELDAVARHIQGLEKLLTQERGPMGPEMASVVKGLVADLTSQTVAGLEFAQLKAVQTRSAASKRALRVELLDLRCRRQAGANALTKANLDEAARARERSVEDMLQTVFTDVTAARDTANLNPGALGANRMTAPENLHALLAIAAQASRTGAMLKALIVK